MADLLSQFADLVAERVAEKLRGTKQPSRLLTVKETADRIGRSPGAVRLLVNRNMLPSVRAGKRIHVREADLERWVEQHRVA